MSLTTPALSPAVRTFVTEYDARLVNCRHVIATLETLNSRYTLVKRQGRAVLIKDGSTNGRSPVGNGEVLVGTHAHMDEALDGSGYIVRIYDGEKRLLTTSIIRRVYCLEN